MKWLCKHEQMASHYIYNGIRRALENLNHEFEFWDTNQNSAFDIFSKINPDIYMGQGYNITRAEIKNLNERSDIKVLLKVGMDGLINDEFDFSQYEALFANDEERDNVDKIKNKNRLFLFNYHTAKYDDYILGNWKKRGYNIFPLPPMGDPYIFYPDYDENHKVDISFIGGYWPYKAKNLNPYIMKLCHPVGKYHIKIFGNQTWPVPQYCGFLSNELTRKVISSSKIYPVIHEPQSNKYGYEILSRLYNGALCKSLVISDYVESINDLFPDGEIPMFDNPKDYHACIDYYLSHENERLELVEKQYNKVKNNYTYDNLVPKILEIFA